MDKLISSLLVEEKWASVVWIWVSWLICGSTSFFKQVSLYLVRDACFPKPSSFRVNSTSSEAPLTAWLSSNPAGSPEVSAKAQIASNRLAFTFLKWFFLLITSYAAALGEWSICLILGVGWGGCVVFFHIGMILQISENSVAVKNISKIMVLFRREISLSTCKEKIYFTCFHFILSSVQHCYSLSIFL